jgi:hypothetical protein
MNSLRSSPGTKIPATTLRTWANLAESAKTDDLFDVCRTAEAAVWCVNDSAKLCAACDESSHSLNAVLSRHERIPLIEARSLVEYCAVHPKFYVEYYCEDCHQPPCALQVAGSDSKGAAATHAVIPIARLKKRRKARLESSSGARRPRRNCPSVT